MMLTVDEAVKILEAQLNAGKKLVVAGHADLRSIKERLELCLKNDIPAMLGPCHSGG